ncbi:MAG: glycosyltransferase family 61 protein [Microscillaceae bacterium]|nr:glycosyltransferase family 61 protein [Microscillaceae bacterium]MDW8460827.1 glycosyltransferase family 61 protein [Cytophagales bacterium]
MKRIVQWLKSWVYCFFYPKPTKLIGISQENCSQITAPYPKIKAVFEQETYDLRHLPAPICLPQDAFSLFQPFQSEVKWVGLEIIDQRFFLANNHLISPKKEIWYEPDLPSVPALNGYLPPWFKIRKLHGTVAYLANTVSNHYGHFTRYMYPLLEWYEKTWGLQQINYFYIGEYPPTNFIVEMLQAWNIQPQQLVYQPIRADRIVVFIPQRGTPQAKYWDYGGFQFVRKHSEKIKKLSPGMPIFDKIYVERGNVQWRKVLNENEVKAFLAPLGFTFLSMDNLPVSQQIHIFENARYIIAPHGSALTNLIYCQPNTQVIEILPYNYEDMSSFTYAFYGKLRYAYLRGNPIPTQVAPCYEDIWVDMNKLQQVMELLEKT